MDHVMLYLHQRGYKIEVSETGYVVSFKGQFIEGGGTISDYKGTASQRLKDIKMYREMAIRACQRHNQKRIMELAINN